MNLSAIFITFFLSLFIFIHVSADFPHKSDSHAILIQIAHKRSELSNPVHDSLSALRVLCWETVLCLHCLYEESCRLHEGTVSVNTVVSFEPMCATVRRGILNVKISSSFSFPSLPMLFFSAAHKYLFELSKSTVYNDFSIKLHYFQSN